MFMFIMFLFLANGYKWSVDLPKTNKLSTYLCCITCLISGGQLLSQSVL